MLFSTFWLQTLVVRRALKSNVAGLKTVEAQLLVLHKLPFFRGWERSILRTSPEVVRVAADLTGGTSTRIFL